MVNNKMNNKNKNQKEKFEDVLFNIDDFHSHKIVISEKYLETFDSILNLAREIPGYLVSGKVSGSYSIIHPAFPSVLKVTKNGSGDITSIHIEMSGTKGNVAEKDVLIDIIVSFIKMSSSLGLSDSQRKSFSKFFTLNQKYALTNDNENSSDRVVSLKKTKIKMR